MAKKLNKNLVITMAALGFAITTVAGVVMVYSLQTVDPAEFVKLAETYAEKEDFKSAEVYYMRAYNVSQNALYLVRAGDMVYEQADEPRAMGLFAQASIVDPALLEAHTKLLDARLEIATTYSRSQGVWESVVEPAQAILDLDPEDPQVKARALYGLGQALIGLKEQVAGNEAQGVAHLEEAVRIVPEDVDFVQRLAQYHLAQEETEKAHKLYADLVERNQAPGESAAKARCYYAIFQIAQDKPDEALVLFNEALAVAGDDPETQSYVLVRTGTYWSWRWRAKVRESGDMDTGKEELAKAVKLYSDAIEVEPDGFAGYLRLAKLYRATGDLDRTVEVCRQRLARKFVRQGLQEVMSRNVRYELFLLMAETLIVQGAEAPVGSQERQKLANEADMNVADALAEVADGAMAMHVRGKINYLLGKHREAIKWFEEADRRFRRPDWRNKQLLAVARLRQGDYGAARQAISEALAINGGRGSVACWRTYANILLQLDAAEDALLAANQALVLAPGDPESKLLRAAAMGKLGQDPGQFVTFEGARPGLVAVGARQLANEGKVDEALGRIDAALQEHPGNLTLVRTAIGICRASGRDGQGATYLADALAKSPDDFDLKLMQIDLSEESDEERQSKRLAVISELKDDYQRASLLARYHRIVGDVDEERQQLDIAKDLVYRGATPLSRQVGEDRLRAIFDRSFALAAMSRDSAKLDELVEEAAERNLDAAEGAAYRGRRLLVDGRFDEAIEALEQALERYPTSGQTFSELGEALFQSKRFSESRIAFRRSDEIRPRHGPVVRRLAMLALRFGDDADFKARLKTCEAVIENDLWVVEQSLMLQEEASPREGIARRKKLWDENPEDIGNLFRLAQLYGSTGDGAKAVQCLEALLEVKTDTMTLAAVVPLLRSNGEPERALELLQKNVRESSEPADKAAAQIMIGEHYEDLGRTNEADLAYLAAADIEATQQVQVAVAQFKFRTRDYGEAKNWLTGALETAESNGSPQAPSIQRMLIETLIRLGKTEESRSLCDDYLGKYPEDASGILLDAEVFAAAGAIGEAIEKLSLVLEADSKNALALYRRAQHRASLGEWQRCIADLEQIRVADPTALNFLPRILLSRAYAHVGSAGQAVAELKSVREQHPDAQNVAAELIQIYVDNENYTDADALVTALLNEDPENVRWLVKSGEVAIKQEHRGKALASLKQAAVASGYAPILVAKLLNTYHKYQLAEPGIAFFENDVPPGRRRSGVLLAYADLLALRGDSQVALDIYRTALRVGGFGSLMFLQQLAGAVDTALGGPQAIEILKEPVSDVMLERANQHILGMLLHAHGRLDEALALYTTMLETAPDESEKASILLRVGMIHGQMEQNDDARASYEAVLAINADDVVAANNLAYLLTDQFGEPELAIPYAKRAVELSPTPALRDTLAWAYVSAGRYREAIAELSRARSEDAGYVPAIYHLGEAYRRDGQCSRAVTLFDEVLAAEELDSPVLAEYRPLALEGLRLCAERLGD